MDTITRYILSDEEVRRYIPYPLLAESENHLNTGRAHRAMAILHISPEMLKSFQKKAYEWHISKGFPQGYEFTREELEGWNRMTLLLQMIL
ncbi:MAG: hypothetical protein IJQ79_02035 [Bacteroidales bacterium]|nr:hypothetical protein [Bacteroidales bacterium]